MADFIPRQDSAALDWFIAFRDTLAWDPSRYQMSQPDVDTIRTVVDEYAESLHLSRAPGTRTVITTNRKRMARVHAEGVCRLFAGLIKRNYGISDADKLAIRVPPINNNKSPVLCAQTSPALSIIAATPGAHTLEYRDSTNLTKRGKPHGVTCLQLFVKTGTANASSPDGARFLGNFTRNPIIVTFDGADRGMQATYFARWGGRKNQWGMWSVGISMTIAA